MQAGAVCAGCRGMDRVGREVSRLVLLGVPRLRQCPFPSPSCACRLVPAPGCRQRCTAMLSALALGPALDSCGPLPVQGLWQSVAARDDRVWGGAHDWAGGDGGVIGFGATVGCVCRVGRLDAAGSVSVLDVCWMCWMRCVAVRVIVVCCCLALTG